MVGSDLEFDKECGSAAGRAPATRGRSTVRSPPAATMPSSTPTPHSCSAASHSRSRTAACGSTSTGRLPSATAAASSRLRDASRRARAGGAARADADVKGNEAYRRARDASGPDAHKTLCSLYLGNNIFLSHQTNISQQPPSSQQYFSLIINQYQPLDTDTAQQ